MQRSFHLARVRFSAGARGLAAIARRARLLQVALAAAVLFALVVLLQFQMLLTRPLTNGGPGVPLQTHVELISHAGVGMPETTYSNSREALDLAAARGFTKVELDFERTSDGRIVAAHDWGRTYIELHPGATWVPRILSNLISPGVPSHAKFMATPIRGGLTPVDSEDLADWLRAHPDVRIVTDIKADNVGTLRALITDSKISAHQLIPQIYSRAELARVQALGFQDVIYTLYRDTGVPIDEVIAFARANRLAVTIHSARTSRQLVRRFRESGVPLYVHTINRPQDAVRLAAWGASGIYTDFLFQD